MVARDDARSAGEEDAPLLDDATVDAVRATKELIVELVAEELGR